jgi:metallo-beta-lactamase class B
VPDRPTLATIIVGVLDESVIGRRAGLDLSYSSVIPPTHKRLKGRRRVGEVTTIRRIALIAALVPFAHGCDPPAPRPGELTEQPSVRVYERRPRGANTSVSDPRDGEPLARDTPIACASCEEWNRPHEPFKIFGNTYYSGPAGLSSLLIASSKGLVALDGGLPQSAPVIDANIRKLGLHTEDVRLIVKSHAHFDHAGGIAALQRLSGARVAASAQGAQALAHGEPTEDDPQYRSGHDPERRFPPVPNVEVVNDGEALTVGDVTITAHMTPGHTPGSTTWTWRSCEAGRCLDIVYADSLNPVSDVGFRFKGDATHASLIPLFRRSIETVDRLPCDLMIAVHPDLAGIDEKLVWRAKGVTPDPFIAASACHAYAADASQKLATRIAEEK